MDPKIIKKTQDTLGKIIKKPPLTEKLLGKPPFRFLHDVITEIIKTSGFLKGLFSSQEMESKNVTAKDDKLAFLQKVIDCVSIACGETITARPSKIIAGHEPEKTNELLQVIAKCIRKNISTSEAIQKIKSGKTTKGLNKKEKPSTHQPIEEQKEKEASNEKRGKHEKSSDQSRRHHEKDQAEEAKEVLKEERKKQRSRKHRDEEIIKTQEEVIIPSDEPVDHSESRQSADGIEGTTPSRAQRPASAKGQRRKPSHVSSRNSEVQLEEQPTKKLFRPPSARHGAPRIRQKKESDPEENVRLNSGGVNRAPPVIIDNDIVSSLSDNDDEEFVVKEETTPVTLDIEQVPIQANGDNEEGDETHGGLVRKILETKIELELSASGQQSLQKHTAIQRSNVANTQQLREKQMVVKEIDQLRNSVQKLCQSATPLAKIIDYIQEDMESMQNELQTWKNENQKQSIKLEEEQATTQRSIEPLKRELTEIKDRMEAYRNQMATTKANILRNQEKIKRMIYAVATRS